MISPIRELPLCPLPVRLRKIVEADLAAVAEFLSEGFPIRSEGYWLRGLRRNAERKQPEGYPAFGFCLESDGALMGAIFCYSTASSR